MNEIFACGSERENDSAKPGSERALAKTLRKNNGQRQRRNLWHSFQFAFLGSDVGLSSSSPRPSVSAKVAPPKKRAYGAPWRCSRRGEAECRRCSVNHVAARANGRQCGPSGRRQANLLSDPRQYVTAQPFETQGIPLHLPTGSLDSTVLAAEKFSRLSSPLGGNCHYRKTLHRRAAF